MDSATRRAAPPFGISMLGVGRAAPAQFPAAGREFTRHSARGPEGPLGSISSNGPQGENIDFNRPFQTKIIRTCLQQEMSSDYLFLEYTRWVNRFEFAKADCCYISEKVELLITAW